MRSSILCLVMLLPILGGCVSINPPMMSYVRRVDIIEAWISDGSSRVSAVPTRPIKIAVRDGTIQFDLYSLESGGSPPRVGIQFRIGRMSPDVLQIDSPVLLKIDPQVGERNVQALKKLVVQHKPVEITKNQWVYFFPTGAEDSRGWQLWWGDQEPEGVPVKRQKSNVR